MARADINAVTDLAGKKIAGSGFGNLVAYEIQFLIDRYKLGPKTTIVSAPSSIDRLIAVQRGIAEAAIIAAPADIKGEEMGLKRLLQMGTVLQIPQAGLAATDEKIRTSRGEVIEVLKAAIDGLDYTANQREDATALIANGWRSRRHKRAKPMTACAIRTRATECQRRNKAEPTSPCSPLPPV